MVEFVRIQERRRLMKDLLLTGILAVMLTILPGCSVMSPNIDELLRPPQLTAQQSDIHNALQSTLGNGRTIKLKYPKRGEYLSAFVMYDLDNDDEEEALVFYEDANTEYGTRINILDNDGDGWVSCFDYPGNGSAVDQIQFVNVSGQEGCDILIGWEYPNQELKTVNLYHYKDGKLQNLFSNTYSELVLVNLTGSIYSDMVLLESNSSSRPVDAKLVSLLEDGTIGVVGTEYRLTDHFVSYFQEQSGRTAYGMTAVFLDGYLGDNTLCTDVLYYDRVSGNLASKLMYGEDDYTQQTLRSLEIGSMDIDGDGITEIPILEPLPGYDASLGDEAMYLINYSAVDSTGIVRYTSVVMNLDAGYMLEFPDSWRDKVTITKQDKSNEWHFWIYDGSLSQMRGELLRIKVYSTKDYHDKFDTDTYRIIKTRGNFEYFAYIPPNMDEEYAITYEQLETMFSLL